MHTVSSSLVLAAQIGHMIGTVCVTFDVIPELLFLSVAVVRGAREKAQVCKHVCACVSVPVCLHARVW
jgi:hypothetical protein